MRGLVFWSAFALSVTSNVYAAGGSTAIRNKSTIGIGAKAGLFMSLVPGVGAEVPFNFGGNLQIVGSYMTGSLNLKPAFESSMTAADKASVAVKEFELSGNIAAVQARYFIGNSFYIAGGLGQRQMDVTFHLATSADETNYAKTNVGVASTVGIIDIGNQWNFDSGVYLGFDWLGYVSPFSSKATTSTETGGAVTLVMADLQTEAEDLGESLGEASTTQLLMLTLGAIF